jgi:hypothetical protein
MLLAVQPASVGHLPFRPDQSAYRRRHVRGTFGELPPGESDDLEAEQLELQITGTVLLEGGASAMGVPAVDLDRKTAFTSGLGRR